jgi:hypothetical protein
MTAQQAYESKNLTYTENFQVFRNYVIERSNGQVPRDVSLNHHLEKLSIPAFREALQQYHRDVESAFFKSRKVDILAGQLTKLYEIKSAALTNDVQFSQRIVNDKQFQAAIRDEAKNLLSGTSFFSMELAVREIKVMRVENNRLRELNQKLNSALTNLVGHVKQRFGLKEAEVEKMMAEPVVVVNPDRTKPMGRKGDQDLTLGV